MTSHPKVVIKKQKNDVDEDFESRSREELISKIRGLTAHNIQLKSIITKLSTKKSIKNTSGQKPFDFDKCTFRHVAFRILYLGWDYKGYVVQEDTRNTIEYYIFEALVTAKLIKNRATSNYHRCGRTDKGVSSFGQVISLDVRSKLNSNEGNLDEEINYCNILNRLLPDDIKCIAWSPVERDFSARFDCKMRKYKYFFPKGLLDIDSMRCASTKLVGTHDFRNLCKMDVGNGVVEFIRNISNVNIDPVKEKEPRESEQYPESESIDAQGLTMYVMTIEANAFLWHQIRCIIGVLLLVGQKKEKPEIIDQLLDVRTNPRKPEYSMASEIPLNLHSCEFENLSWHYDKEALSQVIEKLSSIWSIQSIKSHMIEDMVSNLKEDYDKLFSNSTGEEKKCLSEFLLQGTPTRKYIPLMERKTCTSLEDKIQHFAKRKRIEVVSEGAK